MARASHGTFRVYWIEKLIINFAIPSDFFYHSLRALLTGDRSQGFFERLGAIWRGKVQKYQKLLRAKAENNGVIPTEYRDLCRQTPCGRVRLFLATLRRVPVAEAA